MELCLYDRLTHITAVGVLEKRRAVVGRVHQAAMTL